VPGVCRTEPLRYQTLQRLAQHFGGRVAEQGFSRRVEQDHAPFVIQADERVHRRVDDCGQAKVTAARARRFDLDEI
jgi:hypothetical protein